MKSNYISQINRNARFAREECERAEYIYQNEKLHTKEEAKCYLTAAELYAENAKISVDAEKEHYERLQKECVKKANEIARLLIPVKNGETIKAGTAASGGEKKRETTKKRGEIDVEPWFRAAPKHSFADVAGMDALKKQLMNCVTDAKYASLKAFLKMRNLHSFFFYGPPGCGKTYIIEAFAHEIMKQGYKYICLEARDILSKYVGEAENIVARMFELAEENAPCVVFIDEIDGVCKNRSLPGLPEYASSITTAFLTGYNRINNSDKEIVFIGATNYPERVDTAMLSRVELIRVPLPDKAARRGSFEHALLENLDIVCTVSCDKMAEMTEGYDCRDIKYLIEHAKAELFERAKAMCETGDEAIELLKTGEVALDEALFRKVYDEYNPSPKEEDARRLAAWEKKVRGDAAEPEKKTPGRADRLKDRDSVEKEVRRANGSAAPVTSIMDIDKILMCGKAPDRSFAHGALTEAEIQGAETGKLPVHNAYYNIHLLLAYLFAAENYSVSSDPWQETARHYRDWLKDIIAGREIPGLDAEEMRKQRENAVKEAEELDGLICGEQSGTYAGKDGASFEKSYDGFNTMWQGHAIAGFCGTCGIVASCNAVNQQTGRRLREEDGVMEFVFGRLCGIDRRFERSKFTWPAGMSEEEFMMMAGSNGGTNSVGRRQFAAQYRMDVETVFDASLFGAENAEYGIRFLTLEWLEKRFREGHSILLALRAQDLMQADISSRSKKEALENGEDPEACRNSNHATTIAGFSYDRTGAVKGMWINDTGGWAAVGNLCGSSRVYLSKEKYDRMRENTETIHVDIFKRRTGE